MKSISLSIRSSVSLGFGFVLLLLIGLSVINYWQESRVSALSETLFKDSVGAMKNALKIQAGILQLRRDEKDIFLTIGQPDQERYIRAWHADQQQLAISIAEQQHIISDAAQKSVLRQMESDYQKYSAGFLGVLERIRSGAVSTSQQANAEIAPFKEATHRLVSDAESAAQTYEQLATAARAEFERVNAAAHRAEVLVALLALGMGTLLTVLILRTVKHAETRLRLAALMFTSSREGVTITDAKGTILEVNEAFCRITGYSRDEVLGQNPRLLQSGRHGPEFYDAMWRSVADKGHWSGEIWDRRKDGTVYAELLTINAVHNAAGQVSNYVAMFSDVAVKREHMRHLEHIAHHDALTSLPNRMLLVDRLKQAIAQSQRQQRQLAVVYLDLDGFKAVNDQHGHAVGDELLIAVSSRMKTALRESDTLARLGGDEFVAVLTGLEHAQDCEPVLDRLLRAASDPVNVGTAVLHVSASVGVTLYPQDGADADLLLRQADQAMYQAKQAGKNRYHLFDVNQDVAIRTQRESLDQIQAALERREFVLYYQPKVNMKTGQVIGAEALIRWQHPQQGLLPPSAFLPVIDGHPLCVELGEWVLDTALKQISAWRAMGLDIPVSVNIAGRQLQQDDFVSRLSSLLAAHPDVKPAQLELEILETSALEDVAQVSHAMHACRALGVQFSLDDFGTGYSSLTYLKRLPAGTLKIDQSFVRDMLSDPDDLAIVEAIVGLAGAFRSQVIAEGVETVAHGEMLLLLGCDLAQGYGIARPMPASDMPVWLSGWRPDPSWTAWLTRTRNPGDLTFAFADVEHREWLRAVERFLAGDQPLAPSMDVGSCHLGQWLKAEGRRRYDQHPDFPLLCAAHERLHARGKELILAHSQHPAHEAGAHLGELRALHHELIARLRSLLSHADAS